MKQPGLDHRHRDKDGTIARKHGNTLISTLRQTYGQRFAPCIDGTPSYLTCSINSTSRH